MFFMKVKRKTKTSLRKVLLPAATFLVLTYTYHQMLTGDRGILIWHGLTKQVETLEIENQALRETVFKMEDRVTRLRVATLDGDFVDELARRKLPVLRDDEVLLLIEYSENRASPFEAYQEKTRERQQREDEPRIGTPAHADKRLSQLQ